MSIKAYGNVTVVNVNDGAKGDTGVGVASVTPMYYLSTSYETPQGGQWVITKPEIPVPTTQNPTQYYLWTKQVTTLSNGDTVSSAEVCDYTITGIDQRISQAENSISTKVWEQDILSHIYGAEDLPSGYVVAENSIRDRISSTQQSVGSISSTIGDWTTLSQGGNVTIANKVSSIEQTADKIYMLVEADDGSSSQSSSFELTDAAITAITNKFIIKAPGNNPNDATIISGGRIHANAITTAMLATDAIKSTNYTKIQSNTSAYSNTGSYFNLSTGSIETPNFAVDNTNGKAYINGEIIATSGKIGDSSTNYWEIGVKTDYNAQQSAAIIAHGSSYIQSGQFMIHDNKINTQSYTIDPTTQRKIITYPKYDSVYYDFGMQMPQFNTNASGYIAGISDLFLYARKHNNNIPTMESEWVYVFKVDKDGTIYENGVKLSEKYASISGVTGAYLPLAETSTSIVKGNVTFGDSNLSKPKSVTFAQNVTVTVQGTLIATASNAAKVNNFTVEARVPSDAVFTDTKNTAGSTNSTSKLYLIGAGTQGNNPTTYSNVNVYTSGGKLYSNDLEVVNLSDTQALTNKTYNGYTLAAASAKGVDTSLTVTSTSTNLPTSAAVASLISNYLPLSGGTLTGNITGNLIGNADTATSLTTSAGSATQPIYFEDGIPVATTYSLNKTVPSDAVFTDTNYYHTTGTWNGLTYTATANGGAGALTFTIPTGTGSTEVALGNHTHTNYANKIILAGTQYSVNSNNITITKANLKSAIEGVIEDTTYVLMTSAERSKLSSIQVSSGGTIDFSGVTASTPLTATVNSNNGTVNITHNKISNDFGGTYTSVTVDAYGHVTAGNNPTTISDYGITDAKIVNGIITLGNNTITPLTSSSTLDASKLSGTASINTTGNAATATSATKATQDSDGNSINSTYLKLSGGTVTGDLVVSKTGGFNYTGLQNATTNANRNVWFSDNTARGKPVYNDNFKYNPSTNVLTVGSITGNAATATTATQATQDSDGNAINSTYLKLSGGTMTASAIIDLTPPSSAATWKTGRDKAKIRMSTYNGYVPIASIKTTDGSWDIAPYSENIINFTYVKDTTYSGSSNVYDARIKFTSTGGIDAMGTIAVGSHAVLTYNSTYNCLEFSFV